MAQERPSRLAEWMEIARAQVPVLRDRFDSWIAAVREDPALLWQTVAVRYTTYVVGALVLIWMLTGLVSLVTPPPPEGAKPEATTADFHVLCTNPDCGHHFVVHRAFGFRKFPVTCPACQHQTGAQAFRCNSPTCRGRWVVPEVRDGRRYCPVCNAPFD
jgi:hypothetical protein